MPCEPGFFCVGGVRRSCPEGKFATEAGSVQCSVLPNGRYLDSNDNDQPCEPGYYCQDGVRYECGSPNLYCPDESMVSPLVVAAGYYSTGGNTVNTSTAVNVCERGYFCQDGVRQACPEGQFTTEEGRLTCSLPGLGQYVTNAQNGTLADCEPGYYCTNGERFPCLPGEYSSDYKQVGPCFFFSCSCPSFVGFFIGDVVSLYFSVCAVMRSLLLSV